jgi:phenylacetate-CoA ligase
MRARPIASEFQVTASRTPRPSEWFRSHLYAWLQALRGRPLTRCINEIKRREQLQHTEFDSYHQQCIARALEHARSQVPLYRSGAWQKSSAGGRAHLDDWPVLEKSVLQSQFDQLLAENRGSRFETLRTSGTTGRPTRVASGYRASAYGWAHRYRALQWYGIPIGAASLRVTHDRRTLRNFVLGQKCVWPLESREAIAEAAKYLENKRPMLVAGTPSALFYLTRRLREQGSTGPLAPFARVGGEQLCSFQRAEIQSILASRVIDSYGATETGALAGECPAGSMHVFADHIHLEIFCGDAPAPSGEIGDVVVTSLYNSTMPLVRYRVGDRARLSPEGCVCGLPYPVIADLQARSDDVFTLSDGSQKHSSALVGQLGKVFDGVHGNRVRQLQVRQNDRTNWEAWIEGTESNSAEKNTGADCVEIQKDITRLIREAAGSGCDVRVHFVELLPREAGKFRYFRPARSARSAAQAAP